MKSNTLISKQLEKKSNSKLVRTIILAKKNSAWKKVAEVLAGPRRMQRNLNLREIDKEAKEGETIVISGKVLSDGEINKKVKVVAIGFSGKAKEKILNAKGQIVEMLEEIKKNPEAKGVKIL